MLPENKPLQVCLLVRHSAIKTGALIIPQHPNETTWVVSLMPPTWVVSVKPERELVAVSYREHVPHCDIVIGIFGDDMPLVSENVVLANASTTFTIQTKTHIHTKLRTTAVVTTCSIVKGLRDYKRKSGAHTPTHKNARLPLFLQQKCNVSYAFMCQIMSANEQRCIRRGRKSSFFNNSRSLATFFTAVHHGQCQKSGFGMG